MNRELYLADSGDGTLVFFLLGLLVILGYKYVKLRDIHKNNQKELMQKVIAQTEQITKLEIDSTRFQLNPHAFKNTLSAVKLFAERTTESAEQTILMARKTTDSIDKLSGVLDYMVYGSREPFVSLTNELQFLETFIDLYKLKLDRNDIVNFQVRIDPHHTFWHLPVVPPLITAYFIENAFKHGHLDDFHALNISLEMQGNRLIYKVSNPIAMMKSKGQGGVGYENMQKRLQVIFPYRHTLKTESEGNRFVAHLEIELRIQNEKN